MSAGLLLVAALVILKLGVPFWFRRGLGGDDRTAEGWIAARSFSSGLVYLLLGVSGLLVGRAGFRWVAIGLLVWGAFLGRDGMRRRGTLLSQPAHGLS